MNRIHRYLIAGASSEIGTAFIRSLDKRAAESELSSKIEVLAHCNSRLEKLEKLQKECNHLKIEPVSYDLSKKEEIAAFADFLSEKEDASMQAFLYLPAGKMRYEKLKKLSVERLESDYRIQIEGLLALSKIVLPKMAKQKFGRVLVMLSECTIGKPPRFTAEYVTVKYAALGAMKALSLEYADKNVHVNGISPAMMETEFLSEIDPRFIEMSAVASPMQRNLTVEETVKAMEFLLSEHADYINGTNLNMTGGNQM